MEKGIDEVVVATSSQPSVVEETMKHLFSLAAVLVLVGAIFVAVPTSVFG